MPSQPVKRIILAEVIDHDDTRAYPICYVLELVTGAYGIPVSAIDASSPVATSSAGVVVPAAAYAGSVVVAASADGSVVGFVAGVVWVSDVATGVSVEATGVSDEATGVSVYP